MASSSGSTKVCFNSTCKEALEAPRQGWLCRTGDFADLCDRCASSFKEGKFCDTYHLNASGWRCCESCGKQIHCGCIVSFHMFILLDAGGIECLNCAKTEYILTPNPTWPSASQVFTGPTERIRDISSKNWKSIAGSGPIPWRQAPNLFKSHKIQPELQFTKTPFEIIKPILNEQLTSCSLGKSTIHNPSEKLVNDSWRAGASETISDRARVTGVQYDGQRNLFGDVSYQSFLNSNELSTPISSLPPTFISQDQKSEKGKISENHVQQLYPPPPLGKRCSNNNGTRGRNQPLPRYWPRITDQELQQISGSSNAKITPLFEKVLSASDAGKIGRLVLPKKCAETYLPPISQPEGYPLVVQDLKGKDWVLQFRFWPNNNSRMYVLEGVTPCIQSMQLQAGDTVTFSRLEPEGKLIMGFRKAPLVSPSYQGNESIVSNNEESSKGSQWSEVDKISIRAKRKKGGKMCSNEKVELNVSLEQIQGLLRPSFTNNPTIVVIEGVEFEDYQEAPIIGSSANGSTNHVGSICSPEAEPTSQHLVHSTINHASSKKNKSENPEPINNTEALGELADLAMTSSQSTTRHPRHKQGCTCVVCVQPPSANKHKSTCTCNVCLTVKRSSQASIIHDLNHSGLNRSEKESESSLRNSIHIPFGEIIRLSIQMDNDKHNQNHKTGPSENSENDPKPDPYFKSQNFDLNIQPEREEESFPVIS